MWGTKKALRGAPICQQERGVKGRLRGSACIGCPTGWLVEKLTGWLAGWLSACLAVDGLLASTASSCSRLLNSTSLSCWWMNIVIVFRFSAIALRGDFLFDVDLCDVQVFEILRVDKRLSIVGVYSENEDV